MTTFPIEAFVPSENKVLVRPCYFTTFNGVLDLKGKLMDEPTEAEETLYAGMLGECSDDAYNIRVLVIDDVGKEHSSLSGWQKNMLHHVLRTRFNNGLPTIVTSNIQRDNWADVYGDATGSFIKEAFLYVPVTGSKDLR
jgi:DNA replication protein DnaC